MIKYVRVREAFNVRVAIGDFTKFDIIGYARSYVYKSCLQCHGGHHS